MVVHSKNTLLHRLSHYKYATPIQSDEHARWCLQEACRRYNGRIVLDDHNCPYVEDAAGISHTDGMLRTLGVDHAAKLRVWYSNA